MPEPDSSSNPYRPPERPGESPIPAASWAPFQSVMLREICSHMTAEEKRAMMWRSLFYGFWTVVSLGAPVGFLVFGLLSGSMNPVLGTVAFLLAAFHCFSIPGWHENQRRFLAKTEWARRNEIAQEQVKLFFGSRTFNEKT